MKKAEKNISTIVKFLKNNEDWLSFGLGLATLVVLVALGGYVVWQKITPAKTNGSTIQVQITPEPTPASQPTPGYYVVKPGDYLWKIAKQHYQDGFKWVEIAKANKLTNPDLLYTGQKLILPEITKTAQVQNPAPTAITKTAQNTNEATYIVKKGDMLWWLSKRFYNNPYLYVKVAKYNNIKTPSLIEVGQVIKFPPKQVLLKS
ncbi:MAG: LysM peptidoglycan-binding domain-containing protein [bacterium]|nr:LysM peptidoglycan-binding domain-containing protein [bacterium]